MKIKLSVFIVIILISVAVSAASTPYKEIERIQFKADSGTLYIFNSSGWGVCDNSQYVQYTGSQANKDTFLSMVLAAHMAKRKVRFSGTCTEANNYLGTNYVYVN
ncbi:hypothetical protein FLL45_08165 [Aliikangiella marina]|uniref:Uncharacterized protein n=1 Tax=Aliikangiella marina TaxID=1712262 RepID=A0A545TCI0_9GAMM|nr:hypothetical protein [Aliikangiella marina]TQV74924.1 hypothetical protein FLL45_08165 [Aliikangiella marina]